MSIDQAFDAVAQAAKGWDKTIAPHLQAIAYEVLTSEGGDTKALLAKLRHYLDSAEAALVPEGTFTITLKSAGQATVNDLTINDLSSVDLTDSKADMSWRLYDAEFNAEDEEDGEEPAYRTDISSFED